MNDLFWTSTDCEREQGYVIKGNHYFCLLCDYKTENGFVYPKGNMFVDAKKQMSLHIEEVHGSVFNHVIELDKKITGLSEHQRKILQLFYQGETDFEIQKALNIGSISTIRNHRAILKEKEKQAKAIVTIMGILGKTIDPKKASITPHQTAKMVDDRYNITENDVNKAIATYFPKGTDGSLKTFAVKEKSKIIILNEIIKKFDSNIRYSEKQVDAILKKIYSEDHVIIRRYLIQYGYMSREIDGSAYWIKERDMTEKMNNNEKTTKDTQSKRKAILQDYKAKVITEDIVSGVYQIKNLVNGKIYIGHTRNVNKLNGVLFQLNFGSFMNKGLQADWTTLGEDNFEIVILESFVEDENPSLVSKKLSVLSQNWKAKLEPYGDKGYHHKN